MAQKLKRSDLKLIIKLNTGAVERRERTAPTLSSDRPNIASTNATPSGDRQSVADFRDSLTANNNDDDTPVAPLTAQQENS